eukprot:gene6113-41407_t
MLLRAPDSRGGPRRERTGRDDAANNDVHALGVVVVALRVVAAITEAYDVAQQSGARGRGAAQAQQRVSDGEHATVAAQSAQRAAIAREIAEFRDALRGADRRGPAQPQRTVRLPSVRTSPRRGGFRVPAPLRALGFGRELDALESRVEQLREEDDFCGTP